MSHSTFKATIGVSETADRRRSERLPTDFDAQVRELGTNGVEARILNISEHGFMADSDGRFEVGSRIWVILPGRRRASALVKWTAGAKIGAEFAEPVDLQGIPSEG